MKLKKLTTALLTAALTATTILAAGCGDSGSADGKGCLVLKNKGICG